jgi:hypothetical protein
MNTDDLIQRLEVEGARLVKWLREAASHELRWKPDAARWSMLEVIGHLCDEERDDFRARVEMILAGTTPWPPIDPEGAVVAGEWQQRDPAAAIDEFEAERRKSVRWLRELQGANWAKTYEHPEVGTIAATDLMASWVAHDLLHARQLARLQVEAFKQVVLPLSTAYADPETS